VSRLAEEHLVLGHRAGLLGDEREREHRDEDTVRMRWTAASLLVGHVARRGEEQAVAEGDFADEMLGRDRLLLAGIEDRRLVAERDRLEQVAGEQRRGPGPCPVLVVVRSMLAGAHAGGNLTCVSRR
jgi:hypothetical protein